MRNLKITTSFLLVLLFSCKEITPDMTFEKSHMEMHQEDEKISQEIRKFEAILTKLYIESKKNPNRVLLKIDSLFTANQNEIDKYKSQIKPNIEQSLHSFKAELLYHIGKYKESISELNFEEDKTGNTAISYAANYVKLKDFKTAKSYIDRIGNSNGDYYALGNYYESIRDKTSALKTYKFGLKDDKSRKHFIYYIWTQKRVEELEKNKPLLNEFFFPTGNPSFEICQICNVDNEKREKIMNLLIKMPENQNWSSTSVLESPYDTGKSYYWIRVEAGNKELNYYVDQKTFEIKYFNPKTKTLMTLADWRNGK